MVAGPGGRAFLYIVLGKKEMSKYEPVSMKKKIKLRAYFGQIELSKVPCVLIFHISETIRLLGFE